MSLNHREIDLVLSELDLVGCQIQRVIQPAYDTLVLSLYKPASSVELMICLAHGECRIHATTIAVPKSEKPIRFAELLRSRIRNGRIEAVRQLGAERIVRIDVRAAEQDGDESVPLDPDGRRYVNYRLYARLWSGAANLILTDDNGIIVDALARKPKRGEMAGGVYKPEDTIPQGLPAKVFEIRELPGSGSFNERIDSLYAQGQGELSREQLLAKAREWYAKRRSSLEVRRAELEHTAAEYADSDRLRELGDILMGRVGGAPSEGGFIEADDFYRGGTISIKIDPKKTMVENAQVYYERCRKAASGLADVRTELVEAEKRLEALNAELSELEGKESPYEIRAFLAKRKTSTAETKRTYPGIALEREGWTLLVGRSAKENDELLRRHVKGNDLWLHARDWAGAYVFIKNRPGKSVPLEILLDAGTLAFYYSKGRSAGQGDLYYTHVKYLRRAKNGPKGLVIPTQERNLHVKLEAERLRSLRSLIGKDGEE
jgi:predicted ribosome quality control (RQC) complex YloA/Tae2 family protein